MGEFWEDRVTGDQLDDVDLMDIVLNAAEHAAAGGDKPVCGKVCWLNKPYVCVALDLEVSRRCLGGTPLKVTPGWASIPLPAPESATDERMPAHRRVGMARSDDGVRDV